MRIGWLILPSFLVPLFYVAAQVPQSPHFALQKLADGVYAAIASDSGYAVSNAGIIDLGNGTLIFDTFISPRAAADLRKAALALTGKPVLYVVNSHYHNDHIRGDQEFPEAHIIATVRTRKDIIENEPEEIKYETANIAAKVAQARKTLAAEPDRNRRVEDRFWLKYYEAIQESHDSLRTVLPDLTFEGKMVLYGQARTAELREAGRGHTGSDCFLWLPAEKIAFMGDLLFVDCHPYLGDGFPRDWMRALDSAAALRPVAVVPGHGPVGRPAHLDTMVTYLRTLERLGAELAQRNATDAEAASQPVPPPFQSWWFSRFFPPNLQFMMTLARQHAAGK